MGVPLHFLLVPPIQPPGVPKSPKHSSFDFHSATLDTNIGNHPANIFDHDVDFRFDWMLETTCRELGVSVKWTFGETVYLTFWFVFNDKEREDGKSGKAFIRADMTNRLVSATVFAAFIYLTH